MQKKCFFNRLNLMFILIALAALTAFADDTFNRLIQSKKFSEAVEYADKKIPSESRTVDVWIKLGKANEEMGLPEKALASYLVGSRIDVKNDEALCGVARVYNAMGRPDNALTYGKKAMDLNPGGPGCWEYAKACISLKKTALAKDALEKTVAYDPSNAVAGKGLAEIYWKEKDYEKAIPLLKSAYAANPNAQDAYRIGKSLLEASKYDSAMYFLKDAVSKNPSLADAQLDLARVYYQKSKFLASANEYEKIAAKTPLTAMDQYYRAVCNEKTGNPDGALKAYISAANAFGGTKSPEAIVAHHKAGMAELDKKNYEAALTHFRYVAAADSEENQVPEINFLLADAYSGSGNLPKAIASLEKALVKDKNNVEAYARLADLYQKNNMPDKAKQIFEKCITLKPNDPKLYLTLGEYNLKSKKYRDALTYFEKSYLIEKSGPTAAGIAGAAMALGNMQKAQDAAESAVRLNASLIEPRFVLYKCYMKSKSYKEAKEQLSYILDKKPNDLEYWKGLAECCIQLKDPARCADADKKIIELDKNNVESRLRLGAFYLSERDDNKALGVFKELAVLTPNNPDVFKNLYTITNNSGDKTAALAYLRKYCALRPGDVSSQKYLGTLYYDMKNYDIALDAFRKAVKADPSVKGIYKQYAGIVLSKGLTDEIKTVLAGAVAAGEADAAMYTSFAAHYQKVGAWERAIAMYQKASELDPRNVKLLFELAHCHEKVGHTDDAILWYGQALALNPSATDDFRTLGNLYLKKNKKADAVAAFKKYLDAGKSDVIASKQVAEYAYSQKNYEEAGRYFAMVTGEEAQKADFLFHYGQTCYALQNFKKALDALNRVAVLTPQNPEVFKLLYSIAIQDSLQKNAAAGYLAKYVALKPSDAVSQRSLGDMLYDRKDFDGALRAYRATLSLDPSAKGLYKRFYELAAKRGSPADKELALSGAVTSGEADAAMCGQLGSVFEKKGLYDKAMTYYSRALQMDPNNATALSSMARCQMKTGKIEDAIITYQQVVALNPNTDEEYKILGQLYQSRNKPDLAIEEYKKYLTKKPGDADIAVLVAENAFKNKDNEEAMKYCAAVEKEKGQDVTFLFLYGRVSFYTNNFKKTIELFERLRTMEKNGRKIKNLDDATLLHMLGEAYEKVFDNANAVAVYAEYNRIPTVKDPDCAFRMAGMEETISPLGAARMYERNTLKYPKDYRNYYEAARLYSKEKTTHAAATVMLKKCIAIKDTVPFLWQVLGRIYGENGQTKLELDAYQRYIQKDTPNGDICEELGISLLNRNLVNESIVYLELACALKPDNANFLYQLARGYEKTNRLPDALPLLQKADMLSPGQEKIKSFLSYVQLRIGKTEISDRPR